MFKMIVILRRKEGVSVEEFRRHWKEWHGPLFRSFPQIKVYMQYHVADKARDNSDLPIDGISILEFESEAQKIQAWKMLEYDAVRDDEKRFLRFDGCGVHVVHVEDEVQII